MVYGVKRYTLWEEFAESGTKYFIRFKDGQGEHHELEVSGQLFFEFRQMERRNRNFQQWDERHREFNERLRKKWRRIFGLNCHGLSAFFCDKKRIFRHFW